MIEILHRYSRAVLYTSATAETIAQAVTEAVISRADLSGANLSGAKNVPDGQRVVLVILGSRHVITALKSGNVSVGCHTNDIDWWLEHYRAIGRAEKYTDEAIAEYGGHLERIKGGACDSRAGSGCRSGDSGDCLMSAQICCQFPDGHVVRFALWSRVTSNLLCIMHRLGAVRFWRE